MRFSELRVDFLILVLYQTYSKNYQMRFSKLRVDFLILVLYQTYSKNYQMRFSELRVDFLIFRRILSNLHQFAFGRCNVHGNPVSWSSCWSQDLSKKDRKKIHLNNWKMGMKRTFRKKIKINITIIDQNMGVMGGKGVSEYKNRILPAKFSKNYLLKM